MIKPNALKAAFALKKVQLGLWTSLASNFSTEILAGSGYDWLSLDLEHSPNDLHSVLQQMQVLAAYPTEAVVRLPYTDKHLIKQYLDLGARTLVLPNVDSAAQARDIVAATRYPGRGVRGVSAQQRGSRWGRVPNYLHEAEKELCILAQIESADGYADVDGILATEGIDGVFVGPSDLAAALGHLGNPAQAEVQTAIEAIARKTLAAGKAAGILAPGEADAQRYIGWGYTMVGLGSDQGILTKASDQLVERFRAFLSK